ncbi:glycine zipper 2TM domain-containing protein [Ottowia sp. SB7-C50]|uniref:glycine zipper 2TM domain-containing protein n=1 Tax=Ottowia sp. SB7-C50 TaxID=3081231 RepID=UPI0029548FCD|nr:glycine zipper 2TM domain-containing protein [Ottowia sp. SB7-C50]WOP15431.1 hypothetical protein R0D99_16810 [Ottowia sp. SB7-C50]
MKPLSAIARSTALLALGMAAAAAAHAQAMVNARVVSSTPVMEQVPVSDCGGYGRGVRPSGPGTAVGALVGGLIGSQMGGGAGHIAGAILGTVGGAMLGNAADASNGYYGSGCATRYENRVVGYDVAYDVGGRQYRTRMAQPPGQWLQVPAPDGGYAPQGAYGGAQSYPVNPPPLAGYPLPAYPASGEASGVVTAPVYGAYPAQGYPQPYPQAYPQAYPYPQPYPQPVYQAGYPAAVYPAAPVYVRPAPVYASPVGVNLSIGGVVGGRGRGGWGVGIGTGF